MSPFRKTASFAVLLLSAAGLQAQATTAKPAPASPPQTVRQDLPMPHPVQMSLASPVVTVVENPAVVQQAQNDYDVWVLQYNRSVFESQRTCSRIIFLMVNLMVLAGLYFAWIQFKATLHLTQRIQAKPNAAATDPVAAAAPDAPPAPATELKIGLDGVAINSSFIGLIVLGFSMGFYFFYLQYVYPIHSVQAPAATLSQPAGPH